MRVEEVLDTIPEDLMSDKLMNLLGGLNEEMIERVREHFQHMSDQTKTIKSAATGLVDQSLEYILTQLEIAGKMNRVESSALLTTLMPWIKIMVSVDEADLLLDKAANSPGAAYGMMGAAFSRTTQGITDINSLTNAAHQGAFEEEYGETVPAFMHYIRERLDLSDPEVTSDGD